MWLDTSSLESRPLNLETKDGAWSRDYSDMYTWLLQEAEIKMNRKDQLSLARNLLTKCQDLLKSPQEPLGGDGASSSSDTQLLARGMSLQKAARVRFPSKNVGDGDVTNVRIVAMRMTRLRTFTKDGPPVEIKAPMSSNYSDISLLGAKMLGIEDNMDAGGKWTLFHVDGTIIPEEDGWTLRGFIAHMKKSPSQLKGITYEESRELRPSSKRTKRCASKDEDNLTTEIVIDDDTSDVEANLGPTGLDSTLPLSRSSVYRVAMKTTGDPPSDFYPESVSYCVYSIYSGGKYVLNTTENEFDILNDVISRFVVIHQSPHVVLLESSIMPIFCVTSGHDVDYDYKWRNGGAVVGVNSPVLWITTIGAYQCSVSKGLRTCSSSVIIVKESQTTAETASIPESKSFVDGSAMVFSRDDLDVASNNFSNIIGQGGFGKVYRGLFRCSAIAIKVLSKKGVKLLVNESDDPSGRSNWNSLLATEVATLTRFRHPNLLGLMGYSLDPPCLVYAYMENGSLYDNIHKFKAEKVLSMKTRVSILLDVASGLAYLHAESPPVIHHDINSMNILVNRHWAGILSDFGFSIQLPKCHAGKTLITSLSGLPGTSGYRPPEYADSKYSVLSDIYSFGVVILECYTGRVAFSGGRDANNLVDLTEEERETVDAFSRTVDPKTEYVSDLITKSMLSLINICVKRIPSRRPNISSVFDDLNTILVYFHGTVLVD